MPQPSGPACRGRDVDGRNADDELQTVDIFSRRPFIKFI